MDEVVIRTNRQLKSMNLAIVKALEDAAGMKKGRIPVIYQYLHKPGTPTIVDDTNIIGYITNIKKEKNGDIVGDIGIISLMKLAIHYQGVIDNICVSIDPSTKATKIDCFIVYDRSAKSEIDRLREEKKNPRVFKRGEIPFVDDGVGKQMALKKITEEIEKELKDKGLENIMKNEA